MKEMREAGVIAVRSMVIVGTVLFFAAITIASQNLVPGLILIGFLWGLIAYAAYLTHHDQLNIGPEEE